MGIDNLRHILYRAGAAQRRCATGLDVADALDLTGVLRQTAGGVATVPIGWRRLQADAEIRLQSASAEVESRRDIRITALYVLGSQPVVRLSSDDEVVRGIFRRAVARARHTCMNCGRAGRVWPDLINRFDVLCARCAGPQAALADFDVLLELRQQRRGFEQGIPVAELPRRLVAVVTVAFAAATMRPADQDGGQGRAIPQVLSRDEYDRWCRWLLELHEVSRIAQARASRS